MYLYVLFKFVCFFSEVRVRVLDALESKIFPFENFEGTSFRSFDRSNHKMLIHKQMLQKLPISRAQVKAGNKSENLLNKKYILCIKQKKTTKKEYNNIMNSINL